MKKFLSVLLALAVAFTFTFGSTMSAFAYDVTTSDDTTALVTTASDALNTANDNLDTMKSYYVKNYSPIAVTYVATDDIIISKDAMNAIVDEVFTKIKSNVSDAYQAQIVDINDGSVAGADLEAAKTTIKTAIKTEYEKYDTLTEIDAFIKANFVEKAVKAEFNVVKSKALATLDKVNYDNYSTVSPDAPTYGDYYLSNQDIAKKIVDNAKKSINETVWTDVPATNKAAILTGINGYVTAAVIEIDKVYYVKADSNVAPAAKETVGETTLVLRSATEANNNKTTAEEQAYQKSLVDGKAALAKAAISKALNTALVSATEAKDTTKVTAINKAISELDNKIAATVEVAKAKIGYATSQTAAASAANTEISIFDGYIASVNVDAYIAGTNFDIYAAKVATITDLNAKAAQMKAEKGLDGKALYDADAVDTALAADIKTVYTSNSTPDNLSTLAGLARDLVAAEVQKVLNGDSANKVTINKTVYTAINSWIINSSTYDEDQEAEALKIKEETIANVVAATTIEAVDSAFIAGCDALAKIAKISDKTTYQNAAYTAKCNAYEAKLSAAYDTKVANYAGTWTTDYDVTKITFINNLVATFAKAYSDAELEALYNDALAEINGLKTKAELTAAAKAINDAAIAVKTPITADQESTVLDLYKKAADLAEYVALIGATGSYTTYNTLIEQYVAKTKDLAEEAISKAITDIGTVTTDDEAAIAALKTQIETYIDNYSDYASASIATQAPDRLIYSIANDYDPLYVALMGAKVNALKEAIAVIDASADPLDTEAIAAARNAYNALGLYKGSVPAATYQKLISLETLAASLEKANEWTTTDVKASLFDTSRKLTIWRTSKTSIRVTSVGSVADIKDHGYTVKYKFYKKAPGSSTYKLVKTTTSNKYTYTNLKKGTNKFQVKVCVYDADGKLVASKWTYYRAAKIK